MEKFLSNYEPTTIEEKRLDLEKYIEEIQLLKSKLEHHFRLALLTYTILDIVEHENYQHFNLMINLAVVNSKLSKEQWQIIKNEIKKMYNIQSIYDKF